MNAINAYYQQAQFSLAAYADLSASIAVGTYIQRLIGKGMGETQAASFAAQYEVVDRYDGMVLHNYIDEFGNPQQAMTPTGLSATIFRNRDTGEVTLAIRGTDDQNDFATDLFSILALGTSKYQAQYAALYSKVQEWLGNGKLTSGFRVTGHSLGGQRGREGKGVRLG